MIRTYTLEKGLKQGPEKLYAAGRLTMSYPYKEGKMEGLAYEYDEQERVTAEIRYINGKKNGPAKYLDNTGRVLSQGDHFDDYKEGKWTLFNYDELGRKVINTSTYAKGILNGPFTVYRRDSLIKGSYKNGMRDGFFKIYYSDKEWAADPQPEDTLPKNLLATGIYAYDEKDGPWALYKNGLVYQKGFYKTGQRSGQWRIYVFDPDTILSAIDSYESDRLNGVSTVYYKQGLKRIRCYQESEIEAGKMCLAQGYIRCKEVRTFAAGLLDGPCEMYDSANVLRFKGSYSHGRKTGVWTGAVLTGEDSAATATFYKTYKNDVLDGEYKELSNSGVLVTLGKYVENKKDGEWKYYWEDGSPHKTENYLTGRFNGKQVYYYRDGNKDTEYDYDVGTLTTVYIYDPMTKALDIRYELIARDDNSIRCRQFKFVNDSVKIKDFDYAASVKLAKYTQPLDFTNEFHSTLLSSNAGKGEANGFYGVLSTKGDTMEKGQYLHGRRTGTWHTYYSKDMLRVDITYKDDIKTDEFYYNLNKEKPYSGVFIKYYSNGQAQCEYTIKKGKRHGKSKEYSVSSRVTLEEEYENGVKIK
jgi:antitoxin component YwqK of YwqJK toxin-antitoxin module